MVNMETESDPVWFPAPNAIRVVAALPEAGDAIKSLASQVDDCLAKLVRLHAEVTACEIELSSRHARLVTTVNRLWHAADIKIAIQRGTAE